MYISFEFQTGEVEKQKRQRRYMKIMPENFPRQLAFRRGREKQPGLEASLLIT